jgi:diaminohydroxyphosphoribosylaminopyrimidine deaminase/5-amino-6-(5-phosphoribosylamino)uracil reductase
MLYLRNGRVSHDVLERLLNSLIEPQHPSMRLPNKNPSAILSESALFGKSTAVVLAKNSQQALSHTCVEARKWIGATSPNPPVGAAALDAEGKVLAVTAHKRAGEAHAEAALIAHCREQGLLPRIHTLYVTLEPCNHQGRTPPCTEAIIATGIKHVVIGARDPNPHVKGGGIERLRAAGIDVIYETDDEECRQLIHAFAYCAQTGKPWITIKRAFDKNGSMIPPKGQKTFTSPASLRFAHRLRKRTDAIITGSGTVLADNPLFTVRHVEDHPGKRRWLAILDRRGRVPESYLAGARERGLDAFIYQDISEAIADLAAKGAQDILIEAGPTLAQAALDSNLWVMSVTIRQADPNAIDTAFNSQETMPFDKKKFRWDYVLPH